MSSGRVWDVFSRALWREPSSLALAQPGVALSFEDVARLIDDLSVHLRRLRPGAVVGAAVDDATALAVAMLAISRAGCAFLPMAFGSTDAFRAHQSTALRCDAVVTGGSRDGAWTVGPGSSASDGRSGDCGPIEYIITTSGSTGFPKGVPIGERQMDALLRSPLGADFLKGVEVDRVVNTFRPTFDMWIWAHLVGWAQGKCVQSVDGLSFAVAPHGSGTDPIALFGVPSLVSAFAGAVRGEALAAVDVRFIGLAGEAFLLEQSERLRTIWPRATIANLYGPAEATMLASAYVVTSACAEPKVRYDVLSIGRFIPELDVRLTIDSEAVLSGPTVFDGYTSVDGSVPAASLRGDLSYQTGDLIERDGDGFHYYCGRTDDQVKIAGHRVNLLAVDARIRLTDLVSEVVTFVDRRGRLGGYVSPESVDMEVLRLTLKSVSPAWEVPSWLQAVAAVPTGETGKVRRGPLEGAGNE